MRVDGYTYVGAGNSVTKKEAQKNASRDFLNYLVRSGELNASDVPVCTDLINKQESEDGKSQNLSQALQPKPVFQVTFQLLVIFAHHLTFSLNLYSSYFLGFFNFSY